MKSILLFLLATSMLSAAEPTRESGLSVKLLPDSVAKTKGQQGGFYAINPSTDQPVFDRKNPEWVINYLQRLSPSIQSNGIWIITANSDSYREDELELLTVLIRFCVYSKISVYTCQESSLPNGWQSGESGVPASIRRGKTDNGPAKPNHALQ